MSQRLMLAEIFHMFLPPSVWFPSVTAAASQRPPADWLLCVLPLLSHRLTLCPLPLPSINLPPAPSTSPPVCHFQPQHPSPDVSAVPADLLRLASLVLTPVMDPNEKLNTLISATSSRWPSVFSPETPSLPSLLSPTPFHPSLPFTLADTLLSL